MRRSSCALGVVFLLWGCAPSDQDDADAFWLSARAAQTGARICSWNMTRLGHNFVGRDKDMDVAGAIIQDNCDVVVVEEVMQLAQSPHPGYDALLAKLGAGWNGTVTERPRPDTTSP